MDLHTPVEHRLHPYMLTRYVKFEVWQHFVHIGMRVEVYGYRGNHVTKYSPAFYLFNGLLG